MVIKVEHTFKGLVFNIILTETCTSIMDSYLITNRNDMHEFLRELKTNYTDENLALNIRTENGMVDEWLVHNLLCNLGILPDRTCDVDLNTNQAWYIRVLYKILAFFC